MRDLVPDVLLMNALNGAAVAALTLNEVKDGVAVVLGVVSIVSTLLIIRENLRKARKSRVEEAENQLTTKGTENTKSGTKEKLGFDVKRVLLAGAFLLV